MEEHESPNSRVPQTAPFESTTRGFIGGFLSTARSVLLSPRMFFSNMPVEGGLLGPYVFFLLCTGFSFLVSLLLSTAGNGAFAPGTVLVMALALVMPFVSAALLNLGFTKLLRTSGSYEATFRVICYANAANLLAWIPVFFILVLLQFYEIYLCALGLSTVHRTSMGRALLVIVGTVIGVSVTVVLLAQLILGT
jgi:hypothetical protein